MQERARQQARRRQRHAAALRGRRLGRRFPAIILSAGGCYAKLEIMRATSGGRGDVTSDNDGMLCLAADGASPGGDERDHATGLGLTY
jgi:hypothetical protein